MSHPNPHPQLAVEGNPSPGHSSSTTNACRFHKTLIWLSISPPKSPSILFYDRFAVTSALKNPHGAQFGSARRGGQKPLAISAFGTPVFRPFSTAAPAWREQRKVGGLGPNPMILLANGGRMLSSPREKTLIYSLGCAISHDELPLIPKDFRD
jgi:hypothetical protein